MGSRNAFAGSDNDPPLNGTMEHKDIERPHKRVRLSHATAAIETQCAQPDTTLEVDHMILDYTAYQTINACFDSRNLERQSGSSKSLASNLAISDSFLSIFKARHSTYTPDPGLRLRTILLKLTTLLTQRLTRNPTTPSRSTLQELRRANQERARHWIGRRERIPSSSFNTSSFEEDLLISQQELDRNRAHVLHELGVPAEDEDYEDAFYGTSSCVSLLDVLPIFMQVSAARNAMNGSNLTERWMQLAAEFMLQACLEQYLVFGVQGLDAVDEAFAWGYNESADDDRDSGQDVRAIAKTKTTDINEMFEDEDYAVEVEGWSEIKMSYLGDLLQLEGEGEIIAHLETMAAKYPIAIFESTLLQFLEALSKSITEPVLVQLEKGKLDGMTEQQTQHFLADCGVGMAQLFEARIGTNGAMG